MKSFLRRVILFGLRRPVLAAFLSFLALAFAALPVLTASFSADITRMLPADSRSEQACAVLLNAAAIICAAGLGDSIKACIRLAEKSIDSGAALAKLRSISA